MCAAFLSSRLSNLSWSYISIPLCSKLWISEVNFFIPFCVVELLCINKMGRKNMAGKNSRSCTFGAKLQKYYNFVKFSFEIALKRYLDKFLTWISLHLLKEAWNAFCKIQLTIGTNFWNTCSESESYSYHCSINQTTLRKIAWRKILHF